TLHERLREDNLLRLERWPTDYLLMIGSVLGEHGPAAERALIHVVDERARQLRFLLDEERRRHIAAPRIHARRVIHASENLIAPIIEPGFIRLATQDVDVLLPHEVLGR